MHFGMSVSLGASVHPPIHLYVPSLEGLGKTHVSFSCISSSSSVQVSGVTGQRLTQTFDSGDTMLDGGSLASHSSQHVCRYSLVLSHCKRSHHECFTSPHVQGFAVSAVNLLAAYRCVLHRQGFSSSVCQAGATQTSEMKVYQQCWKEWAGWCA